MSRWITIEAAELAVKALEEENARLKAEVERLRAFATRTIIPNEKLQIQIERLTKAGDELVYGYQNGDWNERMIAIRTSEWNAAKEGKDAQ